MLPKLWPFLLPPLVGNMSPASSYLLFLLFSCCSLLSDPAVAVHIGAIVNTNTHIGREQKIAIEIAAQDFNTSTLLNLSDSGSNPLTPASLAKDLIDEWRADVVIGTGAWAEVEPIVDVANRTAVPVLSLATIQSLTWPPRPFLIRMSYPASAQIRVQILCFAQLVKSYYWRRVILVYEDDDFGYISGCVVPRLSDALRAVGSDIDHCVALPPLHSLSDPKSTVRNELEIASLRLCKVFIVLRWSSSSLAVRTLFEEVKGLGMMKKGHVWITNDDITSLLESVALNPTFMSSYMEGVIGIKTYINQTRSSYGHFRDRFRARFQSEYGKQGENYFEPGAHALRAYDAVHAVVEGAATAARKKSGTLLEGILLRGFEGLSGQILFGRSGELVAGKGSSAFRVINVMGRSYREVGFWSEGSDGFYEEEGEMGRGGRTVDVLGPVIWPGGPHRVPGGWGELKLVVPARTSFDQFVKVEYDDEGNVKDIRGYCIDVFKESLKRLKYDLPYKFFPLDGTYDELVDQVKLKKYDGVIGDVTILATRSTVVDFTQPYISSGLAMLTHVKPHHGSWIFMKPFNKEVWALIFITFIYTGLAVWYLEHGANPEFHGSWWRQVGATNWLIFTTIFFMQGRIHSYYSKAVVLAWLFVVLILSNIYNATLSSILTVQKLDPVVDVNKVGCDGDSFVLNYLQNVLGYNAQKIQKIGTAENYPKAFQSGNITAAFLETPYLRVFLSKNEDYTVYGETHRLQGFGFVFQKGSPLSADFSEAILNQTEGGELKELENKWFSFSLSNCPSAGKDRDSDSLSLDSFWVLFLFTGGTSTIVLLLFIARLLRNYLRHIQVEGNVSLRERVRRLWRSMKFWKKVKPQPQNPNQTSTSSPQAGSIELGTDNITPSPQEGSSRAM